MFFCLRLSRTFFVCASLRRPRSGRLLHMWILLAFECLCLFAVTKYAAVPLFKSVASKLLLRMRVARAGARMLTKQRRVHPKKEDAEGWSVDDSDQEEEGLPP